MFEKEPYIKLWQALFHVTRMHSSRMRTARRSGRPGGGVSTRQPPGAGTPPAARHAGIAHTPLLQGMLGYHPPPCEQNHRRLWKYNIAPTSLRAVIKRYCSSLKNTLKNMLTDNHNRTIYRPIRIESSSRKVHLKCTLWNDSAKV